MNILVVQETDWIDRGPHQQHHLFERLAVEDHEVRVIDFEYLWSEEANPRRIRGRQELTPPTHVMEDATVSLIRPPMVKLPLLDKLTIPPTHWYEIRRQLTTFEPDIIVGLGILNTSVAAKLAVEANVPFLYYLLDHLHTLLPNRIMQTAAQQIEKHVARKATYVYAINEGLREYAIELGANKEQTRIIPGGVDVSRYRAGEKSAISLDANIDNDEIVLFFMGWLYEFSGLREVATDLAARGMQDSYRLLVVGDGDLYDELEQLKQDRLGDKLLLPGQVPFEKIPHYLDYADVCLLPAHHNDTMHDIVPIKMYEYLASGTPVVATDLPGLRKEFGEDNGVVYTDGPEDAFDTVVELVQSSDYQHHAKRAETFVEQYDWSELVSKFEYHLTAIANGEDPPRRS